MPGEKDKSSCCEQSERELQLSGWYQIVSGYTKGYN